MNKHLPLIAALSLPAFYACTDEPLNSECDIEEASVHVDDAESIFYHAYDTIQNVTSTADSVGFFVRPAAAIGHLPLTLKVTAGAKIYQVEADGSRQMFRNGSEVDFTGGQTQRFVIVSEDGTQQRSYRICVVNDVDPTAGYQFFHFNFDGNFALNDPRKTEDDKSCYYVWTETDADNVNELFNGTQWQNGNPGFKLSTSSAKPMGYPTVPVRGGGPDGSDCVKLETKDTGGFGAMVNMRIAAGSLFPGNFDVANALKNARKATQFGMPFKHKPLKMTVWLKWECGQTYQDKMARPVEGVIDEPDAYIVMYRNQDAEGHKVMLDGDDVLTSEHIVGLGRLPHHYYYEDVNGRRVCRDQVTNDPIHGITGEWQKVEIPVEYTEDIDPDLLAQNGYSLIVDFASSWQGAYFCGAIGSKLYVDNITVECEY